MTPPGVSGCWDPGSLPVLTAQMAEDGSASHGAAPDTLQFAALCPASGAAWPPMQQGQLVCFKQQTRELTLLLRRNSEKGFFSFFCRKEWRCRQSIAGLHTQLFIRHLSSLRSTTSIMSAFL